jgi:hypothetical protein
MQEITPLGSPYTPIVTAVNRWRARNQPKLPRCPEWPWHSCKPREDAAGPALPSIRAGLRLRAQPAIAGRAAPAQPVRRQLVPRGAARGVRASAPVLPGRPRAASRIRVLPPSGIAGHVREESMGHAPILLNGASALAKPDSGVGCQWCHWLRRQCARVAESAARTGGASGTCCGGQLPAMAWCFVKAKKLGCHFWLRQCWSAGTPKRRHWRRVASGTQPKHLALTKH